MVSSCFKKMYEIQDNHKSFNSTEIYSPMIENSGYNTMISLILNAVNSVLDSMLNKNLNVLVHCSDGWDRTAQMCSLVQNCLDPYYRTFEGFLVLISKDWLNFGHQFNMRLGHFA